MLRPRFALGYAIVSARRVQDANAGRAAVGKDAEHILIAELADRRTKLHERSASRRQVHLDFLLNPSTTLTSSMSHQAGLLTTTSAFVDPHLTGALKASAILRYFAAGFGISCELLAASVN